MERMRAIKAQSQKRLWERGSMQREEIIRVIENSVKQFISLRENLQEIMNAKKKAVIAIVCRQLPIAAKKNPPNDQLKFFLKGQSWRFDRAEENAATRLHPKYGNTLRGRDYRE